MTTHRSRTTRRGATLYVAVMGVGMIVGVIALTTSLTGRLQLRGNQGRVRSISAAAMADSGVEFALNWMNRTPDWRTQLTNGTYGPVIRAYGGSFKYRVTDADGDLADDPRDHAVLKVVGIRNDARCAVEVDIEPAGRALTCLESAAHSATSFDVGDSADLNGTGIASSGSDFIANNSQINLDVEAGTQANGSHYNAEQTTGVAAREMPSEHTFDWYVEHGTEIAFGDLASIAFSTDRRIDDKRVGRGFNDFGDLNPKGIYWIDCGGKDVRIRKSRIHGTLVLLNAGADTEIEDVSLCHAEAKNYPVLMVQGNLQIDLRSFSSGQVLTEDVRILGAPVGTNMNPPGIPYNGIEDSDRDDDYPARLEGIVYATGTIRVRDEAEVQGNLIANRITVDDDQTLTVDYTPYAYNYPPPGFSAGSGVRVLPGSYRRVAQ